MSRQCFDDADAMLSDDFYVDNLDMPDENSAFAPEATGYDDEYEDEYAETAIMMTSIQRMQMIPMKIMRM